MSICHFDVNTHVRTNSVGCTYGTFCTESVLFDPYRKHVHASHGMHTVRSRSSPACKKLVGAGGKRLSLATWLVKLRCHQFINGITLPYQPPFVQSLYNSTLRYKCHRVVECSKVVEWQLVVIQQVFLYKFIYIYILVANNFKYTYESVSIFPFV